jgi:hypothetical protein
LTKSRWLLIAVTVLAGILRERAKQAHQILQMKLGSWPNGMKLRNAKGDSHRKFRYLQFNNVAISTLFRA